MIDWHVIAHVIRHSPLPVLGFVLIGAGSVMWWLIQLAMTKGGYKTRMFQQIPNDVGLPVQYLKVSSRRGWSAWPAYLVWPCLILGALLLFIGIAFGWS